MGLPLLIALTIHIIDQLRFPGLGIAQQDLSAGLELVQALVAGGAPRGGDGQDGVLIAELVEFIDDLLVSPFGLLGGCVGLVLALTLSLA